MSHHAIVKPTSTKTKVGVVFDASAKDNLGESLNGTLLVSPRLQLAIIVLLVKSSLNRVVAFTVDFRQMYRRINVDLA